MKIEHFDELTLYDFEPTIDTFRHEVLEGLRQSPKMIPSKFFYDDRGSKLFREITATPEYYPTRTEIAIMRDHLPEMAQCVGSEARVIEFGTGAGLKTKLLLKALEKPVAYVPIDISREQLLNASIELVEQFPELEVWPVCADYTERFAVPDPENPVKHTCVYFPGSTIGNFLADEARAFLKNVASLAGPGTGLLIGVDLVKDATILNAAYNDRQGITAQFNLNLIRRLSREFQVEIAESRFKHYAAYNEAEARIEMHLVSALDQVLELDEHDIPLTKGEHIITEFSCKFTQASFESLAEDSGYRLLRTWSDPDALFSIHYCEAIGTN